MLSSFLPSAASGHLITTIILHTGYMSESIEGIRDRRESQRWVYLSTFQAFASYLWEVDLHDK